MAGRWRSRVWSGFLLLVLVLAAACGGDPSADRSGAEAEVRPGVAASGASQVLTFPPDTPREIHFDLEEGHFLDLGVDQQGVDVVSRWIDPKGREVLVVDTATGSESTEEIRVVAGATGTYRLRLEPSGDPPRGAVRVGVLAYRPADDLDRTRATAAAVVARGHLAWIEDDLAGTEEAFRKAIPLHQAAGEEGRVVAARHLLGLALEGQRRLDESAVELEAVTQGYERLGREADEALALNQLGRVLRPLGRPVAAEAAYRRALAIAQRQQLAEVEASALQNLGLVAEQQGHLEEALDLYERALEVRREVGPPAEVALVLRRLGGLYSLIGRDADAVVLLEEALELARRTGSPAQQARSLDALAWARHLEGQEEQALTEFNEALTIAEALENPDQFMDLLARRASVLREVGETARARQDYGRVLRHRQESGEVIGEAYCHANLGWLDLDSGELASAREHLAEAVRLLEGRTEGEGWYYAQLGLGKLERRAGRPVEARHHLEQAVATVEAMRGPLVSWLSRGYLLGTRFEAYEELVGLEMDLHRVSPGAGHDRRALEVAERARVRSLLEHLSADAAPTSVEAPVEIAEIRRLEMERLELQRGRPDSPRLAALDDELRRLWLQAERSPALAAPADPEVRSLGVSAMQGLLGPDTAFLVFSLGEAESYLWVVGADEVASFRLAGRDRVEAVAGRMVRSMAEGRDSVAKERAERSAGELSRMLLGPAAEVLDRHRLVLVPDGVLHLVPFAALPVPGGRDGELLIDRFELVTVPSPSVLSLQRSRSTGRHDGRGAAIIVDPVYQASDPRLSGDRPEPELPADLQRSVADLGLPELVRLPHTGEEAEALLSRLPPSSSLVARDFSADPQLVTRSDLGRYPILHFAAHGLIHPVHPELSGIVLSLVDEEGRARDGFLRAHQVARLDLPVELVVLSACRTALGHEVRGEAPLGLAQAFFRAGSRRVLASYWNVDDRGTAELMDRFYARLLDEGMAPAAALRGAQLEMRRSERWSAPYYWAAFHLQGEWLGDLSQQPQR